jgi:Fe2+ or Zn2+ uptake regulation protein
MHPQQSSPMERSPAELKDALAGSGHRVTDARVAVWQAVSSAIGHLTADEIASRVQEADPAVNLSSVYRSLSLFDELGLIRQSYLGMSDAAHWELAHPDEQFHLRCDTCGEVEHHTGTLVDEIRRHLEDGHGFVAHGVDLVVSGTCSACRLLFPRS